MGGTTLKLYNSITGKQKMHTGRFYCNHWYSDLLGGSSRSAGIRINTQNGLNRTDNLDTGGLNIAAIFPLEPAVTYGGDYICVVGDAGEDDIFEVWRQTPEGNIVWNIAENGWADNISLGLRDGAQLPNGHIVVVGTLNTHVDATGHVFIIDEDDGSILYKISLQGTQVPPDVVIGFKVAVALDGSFAVCCSPCIGTIDNVYLFNSDYSERWSIRITPANLEDCRIIAFLSNGNVVVGTRPEEPNTHHMWILRAADGVVLYSWKDPNWNGTDFQYWAEYCGVYEGAIIVADNDDIIYNALWEGAGGAGRTLYKYTGEGVYVGQFEPTAGTFDIMRWFNRTSNHDIMTASSYTGVASFNFTDFDTQPVMLFLGNLGNLVRILNHKKEWRPRPVYKGMGALSPRFRRDAGCFIDHTILRVYPTDPGTSPAADYDFSEGDLLVVSEEEDYRTVKQHPSRRGFWNPRVKEMLRAGNYETEGGTDMEGYMSARKVADVHAHPFHNICIQSHPEDIQQTGQLIYWDGGYYRITKEPFANTNPDTDPGDFTGDLGAPAQKFDTFAGFGGSGRLADTPSLSPQIYTVAFWGIEDDSHDPHSLNGVHHLYKNCGRSNIWRWFHNGFESAKKRIQITFEMDKWWEWDGAPDRWWYFTRITIATYTSWPKYDATQQYEVGDQVRFVAAGTTGWQWYICHTQPAVGTDPDNAAKWTNEGEDNMSMWDRLDFVYESPGVMPWTDKIFESRQTNAADGNNNGTLLQDDNIANEYTDDTTHGHDGVASWYPGEIFAWDATTTYSSGDIVAFEGRFYSSDGNNNLNNEPDDTGWTVITRIS